MPYKKTPKTAYDIQKRLAGKRGLGWEFTFEKWCDWWEIELGKDWFKKRGPHTGQYVMARNGDIGPYAVGNIRCALVEENHNDYNLNKGCQKGIYKRKNLTREVVIKIYKSDKKYFEIAAEFGLKVHDVHRIKCQKAYVKITEGLEKGRYR